MENRGMKLVACLMHFHDGTFPFAAPFDEGSDSSKCVQQSGAKNSEEEEEEDKKRDKGK